MEVNPALLAVISGPIAVALLKLAELVISRRPRPAEVVDDYQGLVADLREEIERLTSRVSALEEHEQWLRQQLSEARHRIGELEDDNRRLRRQIDERMGA